MPRMTEPAERKNRALKKACVISRIMPATQAPMPTAATMNPNCQMVE